VVCHPDQKNLVHQTCRQMPSFNPPTPAAGHLARRLCPHHGGAPRGPGGRGAAARVGQGGGADGGWWVRRFMGVAACSSSKQPPAPQSTTNNNRLDHTKTHRTLLNPCPLPRSPKNNNQPPGPYQNSPPIPPPSHPRPPTRATSTRPPTPGGTASTARSTRTRRRWTANTTAPRTGSRASTGRR
jgi:hypothetical protein